MYLRMVCVCVCVCFYQYHVYKHTSGFCFLNKHADEPKTQIVETSYLTHGLTSSDEKVLFADVQVDPTHSSAPVPPELLREAHPPVAAMGDDSEWMKLPVDQKCEHKVTASRLSLFLHVCSRFSRTASPAAARNRFNPRKSSSVVDLSLGESV